MQQKNHAKDISDTSNRESYKETEHQQEELDDIRYLFDLVDYRFICSLCMFQVI